MCECCNCGSHVHTGVLKVEGMTCGHCKGSVEKAVDELNGVTNAVVSLEEKEVRFEYNPDLVTVDAIKAAIEEAGYTVL
ncbi:MAG: copper ion binding protein [Bacillota bacterium]